MENYLNQAFFRLSVTFRGIHVENKVWIVVLSCICNHYVIESGTPIWPTGNSVTSHENDLYISLDTRVLRGVVWSLEGTLQMLFSKSSNQSYCLAFDKAFFNPWRVARSEMDILKGFDQLVVSFDVQDGFFYGSLSFEHNSIKESYLILCYFGCEFYCQVEYVSLFSETIHFISCTVLKGEDVINVAFPFSWLGIVLLN